MDATLAILAALLVAVAGKECADMGTESKCEKHTPKKDPLFRCAWVIGDPLQKPSKYSDVAWADLSKAARSEMTKLGWNKAAWGGWEDPVSWKDMSKADRKSWAALGWSQKRWKGNLDPPESDDKWWGELTVKEQQAAGALGYTREVWNGEVIRGPSICEMVKKDPCSFAQAELSSKKKRKAARASCDERLDPGERQKLLCSSWCRTELDCWEGEGDGCACVGCPICESVRDDYTQIKKYKYSDGDPSLYKYKYEEKEIPYTGRLHYCSFRGAGGGDVCYWKGSLNKGQCVTYQGERKCPNAKTKRECKRVKGKITGRAGKEKICTWSKARGCEARYDKAQTTSGVMADKRSLFAVSIDVPINDDAYTFVYDEITP